MTLVLAITIIFSLRGFSQTEKKTNIEILEQNISAEIEKIFFYPDVDRQLQFVFLLSSERKDKTEKKFIESVIRRTAERNKLRFSFSNNDLMNSSDTEYYRFRTDVRKLNTRYIGFGKNKFLGEKTIIRNVSSELVVHVESVGTKTPLSLKETITTDFKGEIPYDEYKQYENDEYSFTQSSPPDLSLFETIVFPVSVVIVSAVSVILFFTVRSK
ncbi:MAG: hypothetical protein N2510_03865 [Ignavibacteria bacterium]|nr:hypothetical protein [Ignavibacteria bacterium]